MNSHRHSNHGQKEKIISETLARWRYKISPEGKVLTWRGDVVLRGPSKTDRSNTAADSLPAAVWTHKFFDMRANHPLIELTAEVCMILHSWKGWTWQSTMVGVPVLLLSVFEGPRRTTSPLQVSTLPSGEILFILPTFYDWYSQYWCRYAKIAM
jgi:hypothetical protein